jgi:hypothetical protein
MERLEEFSFHVSCWYCIKGSVMSRYTFLRSPSLAVSSRRTLGNNNLSGPLPASWSALTQLQYMYVPTNQFNNRSAAPPALNRGPFT